MALPLRAQIARSAKGKARFNVLRSGGISGDDPLRFSISQGLQAPMRHAVSRVSFLRAFTLLFADVA